MAPRRPTDDILPSKKLEYKFLPSRVCVSINKVSAMIQNEPTVERVYFTFI